MKSGAVSTKSQTKGRKRQVSTAASVDRRRSTVFHHDRTIPVQLQLVCPKIAVRDLLNRQALHRLDETCDLCVLASPRLLVRDCCGGRLTY